jgi:hypothetical protein
MTWVTLNFNMRAAQTMTKHFQISDQLCLPPYSDTLSRCAKNRATETGTRTLICRRHSDL